jgi:hypothetical protein
MWEKNDKRLFRLRKNISYVLYKTVAHISKGRYTR